MTVKNAFGRTETDNSALRQHVAAQLATVQSTLDGMLVDQPRRRIVRSAHLDNGGPHAARD